MRKRDGILCAAALGGWALAGAVWMAGRDDRTAATELKKAPLPGASAEGRENGSLREELDALRRERDGLKRQLSESGKGPSAKDLEALLSQLVPRGEGETDTEHSGGKEMPAAPDAKGEKIVRAGARLARRLKEMRDLQDNGAEDPPEGMLDIAREMISDAITFQKGEKLLKGDLGVRANLEQLNEILPGAERLTPDQQVAYRNEFLAVEFDLVHSGIQSRYLGEHLRHYEPSSFRLEGWQQRLLQSGRDRLDAALTPAQREAVQKHRDFMARRGG